MNWEVHPTRDTGVCSVAAGSRPTRLTVLDDNLERSRGSGIRKPQRLHRHLSNNWALVCSAYHLEGHHTNKSGWIFHPALCAPTLSNCIRLHCKYSAARSVSQIIGLQYYNTQWIEHVHCSQTFPPGPDLGGGAWGPGPQASHQKGASHQTLQLLFRAHYRVN